MAEKLKLLPESNIKIQSDDEFDFKIFRCLQRRTFYSLSKNKMVQSKKYRIGRMNYIVLSIPALKLSRKTRLTTVSDTFSEWKCRTARFFEKASGLFNRLRVY